MFEPRDAPYPELKKTHTMAHVGRPFTDFKPPAALAGSLFTIVSQPDGLSLAWGGKPDLCAATAAICTTFPAFRAFGMAVAVLMLIAVWLVLTRTRIGLVIQAALKHPQMVEALGHNVPRVFMLVFGGGCALAGLAGVIGGNTYITEPAMAASVGSIIFVVVVVGGMGSLAGAFLASLLIGILQTFAVALDHSLAGLLAHFGIQVGEGSVGWPVLKLTISQVAPILPYLLLVLILIFRPKGLLGTRED